MTKKLNGTTRWIIVGLSILTLAFNSGVLYNDVKHLKTDVTEIKKDLRGLREYIMFEGASIESHSNEKDINYSNSFLRLPQRQPHQSQTDPRLQDKPYKESRVQTLRNEKTVGARPATTL
jgi:hypothetical protein